MAQELSIFNNMPQLPTEVSAFFEAESNITSKQTVPSLSYEGKVWTIRLNGAKTKLMRKDADGDEAPVAVMRVVLLGYNERRGRTYYEGAYDPGKAAMPACWSDDGVTPSDTVKEPQSVTCGKCPMSVMGSKITEQGKQVTACSEHRMVVVVPATRLDFEPLRMKIAITSDYDGQSPDHEAQGWYAFKNYRDMLCSKQVAHTAMLVTKMKFDPNVAYPKVLFSADKWLTPEQLTEIIPVVKSDKVAQLVAGTFTPNGIDGERIEKEAAAETKAARKVDPTGGAAKATRAQEAEAAARAEAKAQAAAAVEDDDEEIALPGTAASGKAASTKPNGKAATASAKPPKTTAVPPAAVTEDSESALKDLLAEWGT